MPKMLDLIDRVEFQSHKQQAAALLPDIKDAVYDAEDLLDEFDYYALKLKVDSTKYLGQDHLGDTFLEFLACVGSNDYIREVNRIQAKLDHIHLQSKDMGLHKASLKFDKVVRPETNSYLNEQLFGREQELKQLVAKLGVRQRKRDRTESETRMTELPVLSIVGMGGVGKTTTAQQICNNGAVRQHFDCIIWTCVSDDFDIKVLTKEIIQHLKGDATSNNLDALMRELEKCVKSKKFLLVVDDMWDDILKDYGAKWKRLCAPLKNGAEGSRILVTTRFVEVAELVGPNNHYDLKGLEDVVFWDFFKLCAFGSRTCCSNQESLECIAQKIVPKLKGSPLAAKTVGRILGMDLSTKHWENIMESELWRMQEQDETDILPALRLSYLYLPQKLKRCFSICATYPKDHKFMKDLLADIWTAQGYVVGPQEASLCFDALANRSFFQKASPKSNEYVIHDLMHDTAQLISKDECFIIKHASDLDKVPSNVRHLSIFTNGDVRCSELKSICNKKKLRSLVSNESYMSQDFHSVINCWFKELSKLRLLSFQLSNVSQLPESIGNSKHLRYLCLHGSSTFIKFPSAVRRLHHLKVIDCGSCSIERLPSEFAGAISLRRIKSKIFTYDRDESDKLSLKWSDEKTDVQIMENQMEALPHWDIQHLHVEDYKGESCPSWLQPDLMRKLRSLEFRKCGKIKNISFFVPQPVSPARPHAAGLLEHNRLEELVVVDCDQIDWQGSIVLPNSLRKIQLTKPGYSMDHFVSCFLGLTSLTYLAIFKCGSLTSIPLHVWRSNLPSLEELNIESCNYLTSIRIFGPNSSSSSSEGGGVRGFSSLSKIRIVSCNALLSLEELLTPDCVPVVKDIFVSSCGELISLSVDKLDGLQKLHIVGCSKLNPQMVMAFPFSLKRFYLLSCGGVESINLSNSRLGSSPALEELIIARCEGLRSIGGAMAVDEISKIKGVAIVGCPELKEIQQPLYRWYVQ
ncbi:unnamed protein product [Alopecurus aequalis]